MLTLAKVKTVFVFTNPDLEKNSKINLWAQLLWNFKLYIILISFSNRVDVPLANHCFF